MLACVSPSVVSSPCCQSECFSVLQNPDPQARGGNTSNRYRQLTVATRRCPWIRRPLAPQPVFGRGAEPGRSRKTQPLVREREVQMSTPTVTADTLALADETGIRVELLPVWYDVDDAGSLVRLAQELSTAPPDVAWHTRAFLGQHPELFRSLGT